jgi:rare lipoprotein A
MPDLLISRPGSVIRRRAPLAPLIGAGVLALVVGCARQVRATPDERRSPADAASPNEARRSGTAVGLASWYGPRFHGKRTASGERFDREALTAAHRTLPFGACAEVTNLENGRRVEVRINDRGPHARERLIDVSEAAARELGMLDRGVTRVAVRRCPRE